LVAFGFWCFCFGEFMSINLGSAYGKIEVDSSGVTKGVKNAQDSMNSLKSKSAELGLALQNLGKTMTVAVSIPLR